VAAIAIAAATALWIVIRPERFVVSETPPQQQAPDRVQEPAPTKEHVEVRPPVAEPQPREVPAPFATEPEPEPEPSKSRVRPSLPRATPTDALAAELALLRAAKRALEAGNPEPALASVREHARRFANGELAEERWATHVRALCALGRTQEAARVASQFAAARPASMVARALRGEPCANKERPDARAKSRDG
jgi:hypothetical protein